MPSLDEKCLNTNVPLNEAIAIALRKLSEQDEPSVASKSMDRLLNLAVGQVQFKCKFTGYVQKDVLAMEVSLAVFLANLSMEQHKMHYRRNRSRVQ